MAEITALTAGGPMFRPPEGITAAHDVSAFSCKHPDLAEWLKKRAVANEGRSSRTYVVLHGARVVGFYTLAAGAVVRELLPKSIQRQTPERAPVVVLGRLATDTNFERRGIGRGMLQEAICRTLSMASEIGVRALLVHAKDEEAAGFYRRFGFLPSPINNRTLVLPTETASAAIQTKP